MLNWHAGRRKCLENFDDDFFALHPVVMPALLRAVSDPRGLVATNAVSALEAFTEHLGRRARVLDGGGRPEVWGASHRVGWAGRHGQRRPSCRIWSN
jgi:hypothetical protein